jgi:hypothetical protein
MIARKSEYQQTPQATGQEREQRARMKPMHFSAGRLTPVILAVAVAAWHPALSRAQAPIDVYDLADYRLTADVFKQFVEASRAIGEITRRDSAFTYAPLFTEEVALSGDATAVAAGLVARLENHAGLSAALQSAKLSPREYSKFAIALLAAHMANGFIQAGVLQRVPAGAPTHNVEFVNTHQTEITAVLADLGIRD